MSLVVENFVGCPNILFFVVKHILINAIIKVVGENSINHVFGWVLEGA